MRASVREGGLGLFHELIDLLGCFLTWGEFHTTGGVDCLGMYRSDGCGNVLRL